jgi:hypothetical protein
MTFAPLSGHTSVPFRRNLGKTHSPRRNNLYLWPTEEKILTVSLTTASIRLGQDFHHPDQSNSIECEVYFGKRLTVTNSDTAPVPIFGNVGISLL